MQQPNTGRPLLTSSIVLLNEVDLCEALNLKADTLGRLRREKGFPYIRITNRDRVYLVSEVLDWLKQLPKV